MASSLVSTEDALWQDLFQRESATLCLSPECARAVDLARELRTLNQRYLHRVLAGPFHFGPVGPERRSLDFLIDEVSGRLRSALATVHGRAASLAFPSPDQRAAAVRLLTLAEWTLEGDLYEPSFKRFDQEIPRSDV